MNHLLPWDDISIGGPQRQTEHLLCRIEHVSQKDTATCLTDADREGLRFSLWLGHLLFLVDIVRGIVCSSEFTHQRIPAVVVEIDTGYIGVIQSTCPTSPLVIVATSSTIEIASGATGLRTSTTVAGESRSLKRLLVGTLTLEPLQKICSRLGSELIVAKTDSNRSAG